MKNLSLGPARVWCTDRHGGESRAPYESCNVGDHVGDEAAAVAATGGGAGGAGGVGPSTGGVWMQQVHGVPVHVAAEPPGAAPPQADAAVTAVRGLPLAVLT